MTVDGEQRIVHSERNALPNTLMGADDEGQSVCFHKAFRFLLPKSHPFGWSFLSILFFTVEHRSGGQERDDVPSDPLVIERVGGQRRVKWAGNLIDGSEEYGVLPLTKLAKLAKLGRLIKAWDPSVGAENAVVDDRGKWQVIEHCVDLIPQLRVAHPFRAHLQRCAFRKPLLQLAEQAAMWSALRAALPINKTTHRHVYELHLMIPAKEKHLLRIAGFLDKEIGQELETEGTVVHVVAQEQKDAGREVDAQRPQRAGKQSQVVHASVKIAEYIRRGLQSENPWLQCKDVT